MVIAVALMLTSCAIIAALGVDGVIYLVRDLIHQFK